MIAWGLFGIGALLVWAGITGRSPAAVVKAVLTSSPIPHGHRIDQSTVIGTGTFDRGGREQVAALAAQQIGKPYRWGAAGPEAFDCSGLTQYCYKNAIGLQLPRTAAQQAAWSRALPTTMPGNGDLVFLGVPAYHVGIWYNGQYINAPDVGQSVKISPIPRGAYIRFITDDVPTGDPKWKPRPPS